MNSNEILQDLPAHRAVPWTLVRACDEAALAAEHNAIVEARSLLSPIAWESPSAFAGAVK